MRGDGHGVEPGQHRDTANDGLDGHACEGEEAPPFEVRARSPYGDCDAQRDNEEHSGEGAVPELDEGVKACRVAELRGEFARLAHGPRRTTKARRGETDSASRHDQTTLGEDVRHGEEAAMAADEVSEPRPQTGTGSRRSVRCHTTSLGGGGDRTCLGRTADQCAIECMYPRRSRA